MISKKNKKKELKDEDLMEKRRIIAWIALVFFIVIVANILFIHVYVTESVIVFMLYALFFFFVHNKNSFLYSSVNPQDNGVFKDSDVSKGNGVCKDSDDLKENGALRDNDSLLDSGVSQDNGASQGNEVSTDTDTSQDSGAVALRDSLPTQGNDFSERNNAIEGENNE